MGLLEGLLNFIYPPVCGLCGGKLLDKRGEDLAACGDCVNKIKGNPPPYCGTCGRSLKGLADSVNCCGECRGREPYYERSWSAFLYEGAAREALHLLKYSKKIYLGRLFRGLIIPYVNKNPDILSGIDGVIAVPLHNVKFRERGFNQALILADSLSAEFGVKNLSACLKRLVLTRPQSELDRGQRADNVRGTFEVSRPALIKGKGLLIVDDLFTTGATLNECARVLKKGGAGKLQCLTFARPS